MAKQFYLMINGTEVAVSEEVYRAYKRPVWKEKKKQQRNNRCRDGNNIRCNGDCNTCEFSRLHGGANGGDFSLDEHMALGLDIVADYDVLEEIAEKQTAKEIRKVVEGFDEISQTIAMMLYEGYKQKEIADYLGVEPYTVNRIIKRMQNKLKRFL